MIYGNAVQVRKIQDERLIPHGIQTVAPANRARGRTVRAAILGVAMVLFGAPAWAEEERIAPAAPAADHVIPVHPELVSAEARAKSKLRRMLKSTGLDPELIIPSVERALEASGGPFMPYPADPKVAAEEAEEADRKFNLLVSDVEGGRLIEAAIGQIPFAQPVVDDGRYTSKFGGRRDPINGQWAMHSGLDYAAPEGTAILATADGVVVEAGSNSGYGEMVQIRHEFGVETVYAHLNQIRVEVGERVQRGARIGDMGSTGRSTGSHLHYEVRLNGAALNPMKFIEAGRDVYQDED
jgi:murein DD-endopeptidase MepM/ murein hydrolase activator NlpD